MNISARCDYACNALLELALHWPDNAPMQIHVISARQRIPLKYLVHILIQLKRIGLVRSSRGKEGGYNLAVAPSKLSLGDVIRKINGPLLYKSGAAAKNESVFSAVWNETEDAMAHILDRITFEDIVNKARGVKDAIVYQI